MLIIIDRRLIEIVCKFNSHTHYTYFLFFFFFVSTMTTIRKWTIHYSFGNKLFTKHNNLNERNGKNFIKKNKSFKYSKRNRKLACNFRSQTKPNTEKKLDWTKISEFTIILWYISAFRLVLSCLRFIFVGWLMLKTFPFLVRLFSFPFTVFNVHSAFRFFFCSLLHSIPIFRLLIFSGIFTFYILLRYFINNKISPILSTSPNRHTHTHIQNRHKPTLNRTYKPCFRSVYDIKRWSPYCLLNRWIRIFCTPYSIPFSIFIAFSLLNAKPQNCLCLYVFILSQQINHKQK